jgi:UDP-N-acetylmuramoyl-tripeptide--D-alanyl-D-alanine ligase
VRGWDAKQVAFAAGAKVVREAPAGPARAVIDSRAVQPGDLFVGLPGSQMDGGRFAARALEEGAWGVLVSPKWANGLSGGAVLVAEDPLAALGQMARDWRFELAPEVVVITGSVGKTSTKDLTAALIAPHRSVVASRANFNTEIGMPLEILGAAEGTDVLVLEAAMRGFGQIAELAAIARPNVAVITNIAPVHLEQVGSLDGVARAKAELFEGLEQGTAIVPAGEARLEPYLRRGEPGVSVVRFGDGGDVYLDGDVVVAHGERLDLELAFTARHQRTNALAAVAAAVAVGVQPSGRLEAPTGALRGELVRLPDGALIINDCYNASPLSMRAALEELAGQAAAGRRVAILGDMLELGSEEVALHREVGELAERAGVELLVTVGPRAAAMLDTFDGEGYAVADAREAAALAGELIAPGDVVLVKGSRGVGLEVVASALSVAEAPRG